MNNNTIIYIPDTDTSINCIMNDIKQLHPLTITRDNNNIIFNFKNYQKSYKVIDDHEFTFKFQKTQIKAINGIEGIFKFIKNCTDPDSPYNFWMYGKIVKLLTEA